MEAVVQHSLKQVKIQYNKPQPEHWKGEWCYRQEHKRYRMKVPSKHNNYPFNSNAIVSLLKVLK
jgi:hypothetical protein